MIRTLNYRTNVSLSFSEKVSALQKIKESDFIQAVTVFANGNDKLFPVFKETLQKLTRTHYLVSGGLVERTDGGSFQHTENYCPKQPNLISPNYLSTCPENKRKELQEAMIYLREASKIKTIKTRSVFARQESV